MIWFYWLKLGKWWLICIDTWAIVRLSCDHASGTGQEWHEYLCMQDPGRSQSIDSSCILCDWQRSSSRASARIFTKPWKCCIYLVIGGYQPLLKSNWQQTHTACSMCAVFYVSTVNVSALMCWRRHDKQWLHLSTQCTWHPVGNSATCAHCDCRKYTILKNQAWNMMACTGQKAASTLFSIGKVTSWIILHHWPPKFCRRDADVTMPNTAPLHQVTFQIKRMKCVQLSDQLRKWSDQHSCYEHIWSSPRIQRPEIILHLYECCTHLSSISKHRLGKFWSLEDREAVRIDLRPVAERESWDMHNVHELQLKPLRRKACWNGL